MLAIGKFDETLPSPFRETRLRLRLCAHSVVNKCKRRSPDLRLNLCALDRKTGFSRNHEATQLRHRCARPDFVAFRQQSFVTHFGSTNATKNVHIVATGLNDKTVD